MGPYDGLIFAVNGTAGVLLALFFGVVAARLRPALGTAAPAAIVGLVAAYAAIVVANMPLHPYAALLPLAFGCAAWAAAPLAPHSATAPATGAAVGAAVAAALSLVSAYDLWWATPLVALAAGTVRAFWQARPDILRRAPRAEEPAMHDEAATTER